MMRYEGTEQLADTSACAGARADLKMCLLLSDCCTKVCFIYFLIYYFKISNFIIFRRRKHLENVLIDMMRLYLPSVIC